MSDRQSWGWSGNKSELGAVFGFLGDAFLTMSVRGAKKQLGLFKEKLNFKSIATTVF